MKNELIYSLNVDDSQEVAMSELGRKLSDYEIDILKDKVGERINWYEAILDTLLSISERRR